MGENSYTQGFAQPFVGRFVLSSPIVIHMYRPYASEEEYIEHERFSIEAKSMLLIDQPALPLDTAIVFDVTLENGQKPIRAEAKVVGYVEPEGNRPGGLRVRFRRFGAATKAFIDRAVNGQSATVTAPVSTSALEAAPVSAPTIEVVPVSQPTLEVAPVATAPAPDATPAHRCNEPAETDEASGIHKKTTSPVAAPANREALLARLRGRRVG